MAHLDTLPLTTATPRASSSDQSRLWVEVRRGRTRAPRRAVRSERFLIGAGSNCQLQLGGDEIPILHSILLVNEDGAHIDAVVPWPQLIVNGSPCRTADLHDGDQFTIGKFEFAVHEQRPAGAGQAISAPMQDLPEVAEDDDLGALSVAARGIAAGDEADGPASPDQLLQELQSLSLELDRRTQLLARREAECAERAASLLKVHDQIAGQMEQMAVRLAEDTMPPHRARQAS
jgi:hypothetical protein